MRANGWTGGAFSVLRACVAVLFAALALGEEELPALARAAAVLLSPWLLAGARTRLAAGACAALLLLRTAAAPGEARFDALALLVLCFALALAPPAPFGSLDARGRPDPGGGWRLPPRLLRGARLAAVVVVFLFPPSAAAGDVLLLLVLAAACADPAWIPPKGERPSLVFYDGTCGLCHAAVRLLIAEDRRGAMRFAPLAGATFAETVPAERRGRLPDAMVVRTGDGELLVGARAVLRLLAELGGLWRAAAILARAVPPPLLDALYRGVARARRRLLPAPEGTCPLVPPALNERFLP